MSWAHLVGVITIPLLAATAVPGRTTFDFQAAFIFLFADPALLAVFLWLLYLLERIRIPPARWVQSHMSSVSRAVCLLECACSASCASAAGFLEKEIRKDDLPIIDAMESPPAPEPRELIDLEVSGAGPLQLGHCRAGPLQGWAADAVLQEARVCEWLGLGACTERDRTGPCTEHD